MPLFVDNSIQFLYRNDIDPNDYFSIALPDNGLGNDQWFVVAKSDVLSLHKIEGEIFVVVESTAFPVPTKMTIVELEEAIGRRHHVPYIRDPLKDHTVWSYI